MLLTKSVKIKWNSKIKNHYELKGYIYTKMGDEFEVKVEDLTDGSNVLVDVRCDKCKKLIKGAIWQSYKKYLHDGDKYYCIKCVKLLFSVKATIKTKLKKSISFEQWCYKNLSPDISSEIISRWDYELNQCSPNDISFSTSSEYWFKCPRGIHEIELKKISNIVHNFKKGYMLNCNQCNSFAQWGIDNLGQDFLEKYWSNKNIISPWEIMKNSRNKIWICCEQKEYHEDYIVNCSDFIRGGRCPCCRSNSGKVHPIDSLGNVLKEKGLLHIWSEKNKINPYQYTPHTNQKVWWKCSSNVHEDYQRDVQSSHACGFRCPKCVRERNESFLQEKVRLYLESLKYTVLHEEKCSLTCINPKTKFRLPYDNEILELKLVIEVHGIQHYEENSKWIDNWAKKKGMDNREYFHYQKLKDRYKRIYAKSQGYYFLEIPYWTDNESNLWKKLIDNKIKEVQLLN